MGGESGTFDAAGQLDPRQGVIISCFGKKRSGKTIMADRIFMSYPGDQVILDITGNDGPHGPDVINLTGTVANLPHKWPEWRRQYDRHDRPVPMVLRYVPDAGSPTQAEDMDHVIGLAMAHGNCGILVQEIGVLAPANRTQPHTRRLLMHNRHAGVTAIFCGPRPAGIDTLVLAQSDLVYVFELPSPADRRRIADTIGWDPDEFDQAVHDLGAHEYLRFDSNMIKPADGAPDFRLISCPRLPDHEVAPVMAWAQGQRPESYAQHAAHEQLLARAGGSGQT
jgi:hypothetical protein